jgi:CubicO group peptidase (beta-lactamase class C family)
MGQTARLGPSGILRPPLLAAALLWSAPLGASPVPARGKPATTKPPDVDAYVYRTMKVFDVPGLAVAIVKDGRLLLAKGYGVRRAGEPGAVGADTLFGIASNTKAFTCAALSLLVEEGKLSWDDPVTKHLPDFQAYDPWVTRELAVRDLVTHRTGLGLGEGDLMWWPPTSFSRAEIVRGIRWLKPASSLRTRYAYNNVMYVAAGQLLESVAGRSWDDFVRGRLLGPLGMQHTVTVLQDAGSDIAWPHLKRGGALRPVPPLRFDNAAAAAGLVSSAADMARWVGMLVECGNGRDAPAGASCVLKPESIQRMWTVQTPQATPDPPAGFESLRASFAGYGLGFGLRDYRGRKLATHTGGLPGYVSRVTLVPDERLGIVVLTNQEATGVFDSVVQQLLDFYLGAPPADWPAAYRRRTEDERAKAEAAVAKAGAERDPTSRPSLPLTRYAGRYADRWYGEAVVSLEDGRLTLTMTRTPGMVAPLEHWQQDTFVARWREAFMGEEQPADAYVTFALRPDASVERMSLRPVSPAIDFSFDYQDLLFTPVPDAIGDGAR